MWIVDNNSKDRTLEIVRSGYPEAQILANHHNAGFPGANNQAIRQVRSPYILLLNPDTVVAPNALAEMVHFMDTHLDCGICGAQLYDEYGVNAPDLKRPNAWYYLLALTPFVKWLNRIGGEDQQAISGACLLLRRELIEEIGFLDESLFWCEDVDFCLRASKKHYRICKVTSARVLHICGQSARSNFEGKMYTRNVSLIMLINKHYQHFKKWSLLIVAMTEITLRALKWFLIDCVRPSEEAASRLRGLMRVIREVPRLV